VFTPEPNTQEKSEYEDPVPVKYNDEPTAEEEASVRPISVERTPLATPLDAVNVPP
jgi:hypothetical protein